MVYVPLWFYRNGLCYRNIFSSCYSSSSLLLFFFAQSIFQLDRFRFCLVCTCSMCVYIVQFPYRQTMDNHMQTHGSSSYSCVCVCECWCLCFVFWEFEREQNTIHSIMRSAIHVHNLLRYTEFHICAAYNVLMPLLLLLMLLYYSFFILRCCCCCWCFFYTPS